ncbi:unnamed protein product [Scytosiphon promiscuus]
MASLRSYLTSTPSERDRFSNPVLLVWGYLVSLGDKLQSEMESLFSSSSSSSSDGGGSSSSSSSSSSSIRGASVSPNTSPTSFSFSPASSLSAWLGRTVFGSQDRHRQQQQQQQQQQLQQRQHEDKEPCPSPQRQQHYGSVLGFSITDLVRKLSPSSSPPTSSPRGTNRPHQQQQQQQQETRAHTVTAPSTPSTAADDSEAAGEASTSSAPTGCGCGAVAGCYCEKLLPAVTGVRTRATDKTLVLDLDETLIHARSDLREMGERRFDFMVLLSDQRQRQRQRQQQPEVQQRHSKRGLLQALGKKRGAAAESAVPAPAAEGLSRAGAGSANGEQQQQQQQQRPRRVYVRKRPHLREFLEAASELFEVVLFTAAPEEFAKAVVDQVDPEGRLVDHVLSRESCTRLEMDASSGGGSGGGSSSSGSGRRKKRNGGVGGQGARQGGVDPLGGERKRGPTSMVKDLGILGRSLSKVIMVENSLDAIRYHLENGVQISSFYGDGHDSELLSTLDALRALAPAADVRDGIIRLSVETQARNEGKMLMLGDALLTTG